jgi:2-C-methyl-D-erythritol 2,4-cyclodiphosphate synthase
MMQKGDAATPGFRVGIGHDTHRLAPGGPLRLGGLEIPHDQSLVGHSDADVLLHAVTDALLGAAALGDIGELFPDTDPSNRGRDSTEMLLKALDKVSAAGYRILNLDCIVFAQQPKLSPHKPALQRRLAELLAIEPACVGIKAKTGEGVGEVGRQEVMMAQSIVLVEKIERSPNSSRSAVAWQGKASVPMLACAIGTGALLAMWGTYLFVQGWTLPGGDGLFGAVPIKVAYCVGGMLIGLAGASLALSSAATMKSSSQRGNHG